MDSKVLQKQLFYKIEEFGVFVIQKKLYHFNIHKKLMKSINNYILLPFGAVVVDNVVMVVDVEVVEVISNNKITIFNDNFSFHGADSNERIL